MQKDAKGIVHGVRLPISDLRRGTVPWCHHPSAPGNPPATGAEKTAGPRTANARHGVTSQITTDINHHVISCHIVSYHVISCPHVMGSCWSSGTWNIHIQIHLYRSKSTAWNHWKLPWLLPAVQHRSKAQYHNLWTWTTWCRCSCAAITQTVPQAV